MAREYAQIKLSIWTEDDDWQNLPPLARYLYLHLTSSPTLTHCGIVDWRPSRIGRITGLTVPQIEESGSSLIEALYIVVDEEVDEALVRSFLRNDTLMKQPKMATAMATAYRAVTSQGLRGVLIHELIRLREDLPDLPGWGSAKARELLSLTPVDPSTYPFGKGIGNPIGKGSLSTAPTTTPSTKHLSTSEIASDPGVPSTALDVSLRPDVERLCDHLATRIAEDGSKRPSIGKTWRDAARLLIDKDSRTEAEVHAAIDWSQDHAFWRTVILSMPNLRDKYDQMRKQAMSETSPQKSRQQRETDSLFEQAARNMGLGGTA